MKKMQTTSWQQAVLAKVMRKFTEFDCIHAIVLAGSLVELKEGVDDWSDIDLKLVIDDDMVSFFLEPANWTMSLGKLIGVEKHDDDIVKTIRLCFENFERIDLVTFPRTYIEGRENVFSPSDTLLWGNHEFDYFQYQKKNVAEETSKISFDEEALSRKVDALWFMGSQAIVKVVRNDLLIAFHLTLLVMQGVLELQMIRRDLILGTNIHRKGSWGNELVSQFPSESTSDSPQWILIQLQKTCQLLDQVANEIVPDYEKRSVMQEPVFQKAKRCVNDQ